MTPDILPGDAVIVDPAGKPGICIAVMPSNHVPDAELRGLSAGTLGWSFYVMVNEPIRFVGPIRRAELRHAY